MTDPCVDNVRSVWARADAIDRAEGALAYARYHQTLSVLARHYGMPLPGVVGAFAALSPNADYIGNLRSVVTLLEGARRGIPVEELTVSTYKACRTRAWAFLHGADFLEVTRGPKTRNFYRNILDPTDPDAVTIDGHMVCVARAQRMTMKDVVRSRFRYTEIATLFRTAAADIGIIPSQLQATCWFTWKRIHQVVYNAQLNAFMAGNQWACLIDDPLSIRPFRIGRSDVPKRVGAKVTSHVTSQVTIPLG